MEATTTSTWEISKEDLFNGLIFGQNPFYHPISHLIPFDPSSIGIFYSKRSSLPSPELWLGWPDLGSPWFVMKPLSSRLTIYGITAIPLHSLFSFLFYISTIPYQPLAMSISSHHHEQTLNLTEEEALVHEFDNISVRPDASLQSFFLVAKILTPKTIKADWVANAMKDAWIVRCPFSFSDYHSDRRRVMEGQPWHFDRNLILFALPDEFDIVVPSQVNFIPLWIQVHLIPFGKRSTDLAKFLSEQLRDLIEDAINQFLVPNMVNTSLTLDAFTDVPRVDKGKAVMVSECPRIILSPPPMNLSGVKRSFTRQNVQVGNSVREMLKCARQSY
ncbi:hypothetical protein F8388_012631 [Cannabis sativa]|uniref:DUF4283 domain-containing protein n=1 Tax=Cannabis sativa TaxID=3483 RepID=A0A7J6HCY2_CANSA|nr:hypothetical protein F8388_012631 [Cannabis sativa]